MKLRTVDGIDVRGRRVVLRAGLNVPIVGGRVVDDFRLSRAARTIQYLSDKGAKVTLLSHVGRDGESVRPVMLALAAHVPSVRMRMFEGSPHDALPEISKLQDGEVLVLENMRRFEGEQTNDPGFASILASFGELYVNDAFADAHRTHASTFGIAKLLYSVAGMLMVEEVAKLSEALLPPHPSVAVIGGAKFETKEPLIERLVDTYDRVCVGGAIVNDFFKAKGYGVGVSMTSTSTMTRHLRDHPRIELPIDIVNATDDTTRISAPQETQAYERISDAGPQTGRRWAKHVEEAKFVLMNGPLGIYEKGFNTETERLARALAESKAHAVVGGGDTIAALQKFNFDPERIFLSTGGGAMLQFLADGTLPALETLKQ